MKRGEPLHNGEGGEGFTLWSKNPSSPPSACRCHHPLRCEIIKKGPTAHFDFYLGHPVVEQTLMQTNCVLEPSVFSIFNDISHLAALLHEEFSVFLLVITCPDQSWIGHQFCTAAFCTILHIWHTLSWLITTKHSLRWRWHWRRCWCWYWCGCWFRHGLVKNANSA